MIRVKIKDILNEMGKSKYWFIQQMGGNQHSLNRLIENKTNNIYFSNLDKICKILNRPVGEIIVRLDDEQSDRKIQ